VPTDATELFQEGVIIPPTQLFRAGELDENLFGLIKRNVRLPDVFTGDLMAQVAAGRLGGLRLREMFAAHGTAAVLEYIEELLARAERLTRREIEAIPDGDYRFQDYLDDDGVELGRRVKIVVTVRVRGAAMTFDFTGTDSQVRGPFNSVPASTLSAVYYAIRAFSDPAIPNNGGCFRAVDAVLPEGTVVNPRPPAPVSCRTATIKRIADTIQGALVRALPGRRLRDAAGDGVRGARSRDRRAVRGQRAGRGGHGRSLAEGRDRRHRDRRDELHEHPGRVGGDELSPAHSAHAALDGLGRTRAVPRRPGAGEGLRGHPHRRRGRPPG
jgi:N-methylhydantoinase B